MNVVVLYGNLTRDPERKTVKSDLVIGEFGLAWSEVRKGENVSHFFDITAFGKTAETVLAHKKKGDPVIVRGRLQYEAWTDKATGAKRSKVKVIAEQVQFVGKKSDRDAAPQGDGFGDPAQGSPDDARLDLSEIPF